MLEFCAAKKIYPETEVVSIQYANEALERMIKKDVKYRFVIDIGSSLKWSGYLRECGFAALFGSIFLPQSLLTANDTMW